MQLMMFNVPRCRAKKNAETLYLLTTETNGSGTHAQVLGDLDESVGHLRGVGTAGLGGNADASGRVHEGGGALHGLEGRVGAADALGGSCERESLSTSCSSSAIELILMDFDGWVPTYQRRCASAAA